MSKKKRYSICITTQNGSQLGLYPPNSRVSLTSQRHTVLSSSLLSKDLTFETTSSASNCSKLFSLFHLPNIFPGQNEMSCYLMQMPLVFHCSLPLPKPRMPCLISACSNPTQLQGPAPPAGYNLFLA